MESATRFERDSRCKALGATSANVLKRTSHVYIWLKKWIIDSAFTILQNAEKLMQAFFSVKRFLKLGPESVQTSGSGQEITGFWRGFSLPQFNVEAP